MPAADLGSFGGNGCYDRRMNPVAWLILVAGCALYIFLRIWVDAAGERRNRRMFIVCLVFACGFAVAFYYRSEQLPGLLVGAAAAAVGAIFYAVKEWLRNGRSRRTPIKPGSSTGKRIV
jgi:hypothetical protein